MQRGCKAMRWDLVRRGLREAEHLLLDRGVQLLLHLQVLAGGLGVRVQVEGRAVRDADLCSTPGPCIKLNDFSCLVLIIYFFDKNSRFCLGFDEISLF